MSLGKLIKKVKDVDGLIFRIEKYSFSTKIPDELFKFNRGINNVVFDSNGLKINSSFYPIDTVTNYCIDIHYPIFEINGDKLIVLSRRDIYIINLPENTKIKNICNPLGDDDSNFYCIFTTSEYILCLEDMYDNLCYWITDKIIDPIRKKISYIIKKGIFCLVYNVEGFNNEHIKKYTLKKFMCEPIDVYNKLISDNIINTLEITSLGEI
jgi:hypothetical protein